MTRDPLSMGVAVGAILGGVIGVGLVLIWDGVGALFTWLENADIEDVWND